MGRKEGKKGARAWSLVRNFFLFFCEAPTTTAWTARKSRKMEGVKNEVDWSQKLRKNYERSLKK